MLTLRTPSDAASYALNAGSAVWFYRVDGTAADVESGAVRIVVELLEGFATRRERLMERRILTSVKAVAAYARQEAPDLSVVEADTVERIIYVRRKGRQLWGNPCIRIELPTQGGVDACQWASQLKELIRPSPGALTSRPRPSEKATTAPARGPQIVDDPVKILAAFAEATSVARAEAIAVQGRLREAMRCASGYTGDSGSAWIELDLDRRKRPARWLVSNAPLIAPVVLASEKDKPLELWCPVPGQELEVSERAHLAALGVLTERLGWTGSIRRLLD